MQFNTVGFRALPLCAVSLAALWCWRGWLHNRRGVLHHSAGFSWSAWPWSFWSLQGNCPGGLCFLWWVSNPKIPIHSWEEHPGYYLRVRWVCFPWLTIGNSNDDDCNIVMMVIVIANYWKLTHQLLFLCFVYINLFNQYPVFFISVFGKEQSNFLKTVHLKMVRARIQRVWQ